MKPDIHPKYFPNARVICACGHTWTTGATQPEIRVDVCSNCHPFYTGEQRIVDTAGRVDRFRMRLAQKREEKSTKKQRKQKVLVIGPDEETRPAERPAAELPTVDLAPVVPEPEVMQPEPEPVVPAVEPVAEREPEPEVRKRTVVEGSESELPVQPSAEAEGVELPLDDDERPKRRSTTRRSRSARIEAVEGGARPVRKTRSRKPAEASAPAEASGAEPTPDAPEAPAPEASTNAEPPPGEGGSAVE
jgi:large subunit ribosomal protein L31